MGIAEQMVNMIHAGSPYRTLILLHLTTCKAYLADRDVNDTKKNILAAGQCTVWLQNPRPLGRGMSTGVTTSGTDRPVRFT